MVAGTGIVCVGGRTRLLALQVLSVDVGDSTEGHTDFEFVAAICRSYSQRRGTFFNRQERSQSNPINSLTDRSGLGTPLFAWWLNFEF